MIKTLIGWLLEKLLILFDHEAGREDVRSYVCKKYNRFQKAGHPSRAYLADLAELTELMKDLGWLENEKDITRKKDKDTRVDTHWLEQFKNKKAFSRGALLPGSGKYLDLLDETTHGEDKALVADAMEKLLRHVEVKREKSLRKFTEDIGERQAWLERLDISLLFSRAARRHRDLRFLNASLKMNEWYLRQITPPELDEVNARLLLALAEQEKSAGELLA